MARGPTSAMQWTRPRCPFKSRTSIAVASKSSCRGLNPWGVRRGGQRAADQVEVVRWLLEYHQAALVSQWGRLAGIVTLTDLYSAGILSGHDFRPSR